MRPKIASLLLDRNLTACLRSSRGVYHTGFSIFISLVLIFTWATIAHGEDEFIPVEELLDEKVEEFVPIQEVDSEGYVTDPALLAELNREADYLTIEESRKKELQKARKHEIVYNLVVFLLISCVGGIIWSKREHMNSERLKSAYLVWIFANFMLLIVSPFPFGIRYSFGRDYKSFYPFIRATSYDGLESGLFFDRVDQYDISEFIFYALAPGVIWWAMRTWRAGGSVKERKRRGAR